jgi:acyl carrier protein
LEDYQAAYSDDLKAGPKRSRNTENVPNAERNIFREMREQRKWYKNLKIHHTELSTVVNVLEQQWQIKNAMQAKKAQIDRSSTASLSELDHLDQIWTGALQILMEELGVEAEDLEDSAIFTDLGLESSLLVSAISRMRQELSLEIHPSTVANCFTVRDFRNFIETSCNGYQSLTPKESAQTPSKEVLDSRWANVLQIIVEESGIEAAELSDDANLGTLGIDSLLLVGIFSRVKNEVDENFTFKFPSIYPDVRELREMIFATKSI